MILDETAWVLLKDIEVSSAPKGLWTVALDYIAGPQQLKLTADPQQQWTFSKAENRKCGPGGQPQSNQSLANCLCEQAAKGCLIGKIGGSSADYKSVANTSIFPVGAACVIELDKPTAGAASTRGALFLTMNDEVAGFVDHEGSITVKLWVPAK